MKLLRKISPKHVLGTLPEVAEGETVEIYQCYGEATKIREFTNTFGTDYVLCGQFEGVITETGELFTSAQCFLPKTMHDMAVAKVKGGESIKFAVKIGMRGIAKRGKGDRGYEFTCESLLEVQPSNAIAELRGMLGVSDSAPALAGSASKTAAAAALPNPASKPKKAAKKKK